MAIEKLKIYYKTK